MNAGRLLRSSLLIAIAILGITVTQAQDRIFTYTYQSTVLFKGQRELESWNTVRTGRDNYYVRYDNRTEYEVGLGSNLQTAFYLNLTTMTKTISEGGNNSLATENEIGFSNEWKLKLLDPVADPIGLALYGEVGISSNEFELEGKIIIDKKIGKFTIATNGVYEQEYAPDYMGNELEWEKEGKLEGDLAFAYSVSPRFHITQENVMKSVIVGNEITNSALYSGIGFSHVQEKFWVNFTVLPQVTSFKGATNTNLNLNEYEKIQFRLLF
jgi:hypothetical protein